jgi:hypothetical protein
MASFKKDGKVWRVQVYVHGARTSGTFKTKKEAEAWAKAREEMLRTLPILRRRQPLLSGSKSASLRRLTDLLDKDEIVRRAKANAAVSGVYFLVKNNDIVYIGQSQNVHARLTAHGVLKEFDGFHVIPCPAQELLPLEASYIRKFNPPLNIRKPAAHNVFRAVS